MTSERAEECPVGGCGVIAPHYHRDTLDGDEVVPIVRHELADFNPENGHLHTCLWQGGAGRGGAWPSCPCAVYLYEMVQDLEAEVRRPLTKRSAQPTHTDGSPAEPYGIQTNLLGRAVEKVWGAFHPDRGAF